MDTEHPDRRLRKTGEALNRIAEIIERLRKMLAVYSTGGSNTPGAGAGRPVARQETALGAPNPPSTGFGPLSEARAEPHPGVAPQDANEASSGMPNGKS